MKQLFSNQNQKIRSEKNKSLPQPQQMQIQNDYFITKLHRSCCC